MKIQHSIAAIVFMFCFCTTSWAQGYGQSLCQTPNYHCIQISKGQTWASLFPDEEARLLVKKVNRMNTPLQSGMTIAVPNDLSVSVMSLAPFPNKIESADSNLVQVSLSKLAWGAYDKNGELVNWGPISAGKNYCSDVGRGCRTPVGSYRVYREQGPSCISHAYPVGKGGAPMPYCMHFFRGYALHGSPTVPGFNASHGCVRMFTEDAMWLNLNFVEVGSTVKIVP